MHYSPVSYFSLGRVYPRDRLREPFPARHRHRLVPDPYAHTPPVRITVSGGGRRVVAVGGGRRVSVSSTGGR